MVDGGRWTVDKTVDGGRWMVEDGLWMVGDGRTTDHRENCIAQTAKMQIGSRALRISHREPRMLMIHRIYTRNEFGLS